MRIVALALAATLLLSALHGGEARHKIKIKKLAKLAIVGKAFSPKLIPVPLPLFHHKYHKVPVAHPVPVHFHHDTHYVQEAWPAYGGGDGGGHGWW
ncbi:secreted protein, putative [Ixodes scapularis]|uniref:Secreted protein, putative n=1 Tax=Ixodes scapularis TaxID=6945 RepID=B7PPM3_IXOSC|nr:secreted protein, putative [Ixodes scapularis]|eukprot:XP_002435715.1 secreted protein, putative [Ixodes scapularis]